MITQLICIIFTIIIIRKIILIFLQEKVKKTRFLLVIAHPDDETMFFWPFISSKNNQITILCLSSGDYEKVGKRRKIELLNACENLNIECVIDNFFEDNSNWNSCAIVKILKKINLTDKFDCIVTFDEYGVSNHKNHISCHFGVKKFAKLTGIPAYYLKSLNIFEKYIIYYKILGNTKKTLIYKSDFFSGRGFFLNNYKSQLKWYRYFYALFSTYFDANLLIKN